MLVRRVRPLALAVALLAVLTPVGKARDGGAAMPTAVPVRAKTVGEASRQHSVAVGAREVNARRTHGASAPSQGRGADRRGDALASVPSGSSQRAAVPKLTIPGQGFTFAFPPDTVGEAGTQQFIQMINDGSGTGGTRVGVYDKTTGAELTNFLLSSLAPDGHPCQNGAGDPIPIFDQYVNRWILTEFISPDSPVLGVCMYVFSGANVLTDSAVLYTFATPFFPDYPKWSVTSEAYFFSTNEEDGPAIYAVDRAQVMLGQPTTPIRRVALGLPGFGFQSIAPADLDGPGAPPGNAPGVFVRHRDDEVHDRPGTPGDFLELFEFDPDFATPANSTFLGPLRIAVSEFDSDLCGTFSLECVKQKKTRAKLDPLREVVMNRPLLRTFTTHQSLVGAFATNVGVKPKKDVAGVRWFELRRPAGVSTGGWTLFQEGTVGSPDVGRWMASIAMNGAGDIALGYSASGRKMFPSILYTGRHAGDPAGVMTQGETVMVAGTKSQRKSSRWGDYSAMSVDPSDDTTFWYTNEVSGAKSVWQTAIGSFTFN
jgi:hypothetical protein